MARLSIRKPQALRRSGEVRCGETEGPCRTDYKTGVLGSVEEVDRILRVVLVIDCDDKSRDRGHILDKLGGTLDHDGLIGVIGCDRAAGVRGEVSRLPGGPTRAKPERLASKDGPPRRD